MAINPIYEKWSKKSSWDPSFYEKLLSFGKKSTEDEINKAFSESLKFINNKIISSIGVGTHLLNEFTVAALSYSYVSFLKLKNIEEGSKIFLSLDNSFASNIYMNIFARVLNEYCYKTVIFNDYANIPISHTNLGSENSNSVASVIFKEYDKNSKIFQIAFFWSNGSPLSNEDMMHISWELQSVDYLTITIPDKGISFEYDYSGEKYLEALYNKYSNNHYLNSNSILSGFDFTNVSNTTFYETTLKKLELPYFAVKRQKTKIIYNASEQKHLSKVYWESLSRKSKVNIVINTEGTGLNLNVKYKSVYKYFKPDEIAALYLNFLINDDPDFDKSYLNNSFLAKTYQAGSLTQSVALENNIDVWQYSNRSDLWVYTEKTKKNLLFAFTHHNEFVPNKRLFNGYDSNHFALEIVRMVNYYSKFKNLTLFDVLTELYAKYSRFQLSVKSYLADSGVANRFINRLNNVETIASKYNIVRIEELNKKGSADNKILYKLSFKNAESCIIEYSKIFNQLNIYCETVQQKKEENSELMMVVRNREIIDGIIDLKEDNNVSKLTIWSFAKYFIYFAIFMGIILFLFYSVYNLKGDGVGGSPKQVFDAFGKKLYTDWDKLGNVRSVSNGYIVRSAFAFMVFSVFIYCGLQALIFKRTISLQGYKVKWSDLYIGSFIGVIIQTITPKSIGGDIGTYWYLRRRNIPRPVLFSTIIVNTFLWQIVNVLMTLIFVPTGIYIFHNFFSSHSVQSNIFIIMLVLGLIFDTGLSVLLLIMALNKKIQKILIKATIALIEWLPFVKSYDSFAIKAKYEYELYALNMSMKKCFKNIGVFFELLIYKLIPSLITTTAIFGKAIDIIQPNVAGGFYMNLTIQNSLIRVSNAISLTPGGTGTGDYLYKVLVKESLQGTAYDGFNANQNASILTAMGTFGTVIIPSILSAILLVVVYCGEKRVDYYNKKMKNYNLVTNATISMPRKTKTNYYKIAMPICLALTVASFISFIFIH
ncbi:lysylphosphatidylglycerol synthase transmembrane domain-containing protein [Mycoplasmopsis felifaucium]|uniref:lysylphosphatidylglycerol synthase transmembrane domain-containing protein n=1 Tax=Mycoplasmopsis felifaucium TaxID=35768 RepID=UPI0004804BB7|nr:lysylphosphatidylglycerol synthase transmembrane domain-containing protein [Mycoplasmopsis felifaucium]